MSIIVMITLMIYRDMEYYLLPIPIHPHPYHPYPSDVTRICIQQSCLHATILPLAINSMPPRWTNRHIVTSARK